MPPVVNRALLGLVVVAALAVAVRQVALCAECPRDRWSNLSHDRNAHYAFALRLATDARAGDLVALARSLDNGSNVWMPLQGVVAGGLMAAFGPDWRLAVAPSAAGLALAIVFGFLATRRLVPAHGDLAGLAAALLVAMSPAHRAYATDVMLESLGAGLTAFAVWAYLVCVQDGGLRGGALLGLALTLLFFHKLNYWLLIAVAVAIAELARRPLWYLELADRARRGVDWAAWWRAQLRQPLNYALLAAVAFAGAVAVSGGGRYSPAGLTVKVESWRSALVPAYACLLLRVALGWRAGGAAVVADWLGPRAVQVVWWHIVPAAVWLLLPRRLAGFLWYLSHANSEPDRVADLAAGTKFYLDAARFDYHASPWLVWAVLGCVALAVVAWFARGLSRGATVVVALALVSFALAASHPNTKYRMSHTWAPAWWFAAAAGAAVALRLLDRTSLRRAGPAALGAGLVALAAWQWPALTGPGWAAERGLRRPAEGTTRDVTDAYLPSLSDAGRVLVVSNEAFRFVARWSFLERYPDRPRAIDVDFREVGCPGPASDAAFDAWLERTACDAVVTVEVAPGSRLYEGEVAGESNALAIERMKRQTKFRAVERTTLPQQGCVVTVWRR